MRQYATFEEKQSSYPSPICQWGGAQLRNTAYCKHFQFSTTGFTMLDFIGQQCAKKCSTGTCTLDPQRYTNNSPQRPQKSVYVSRRWCTAQKFSFFSRRKNTVDFFLENGRYRPNEQISKEKKIAHREKSRFLPIFLFSKMEILRILVHFIP